MIRVRIVREDDLEAVHALAELAAPGMTTLPPDRDALRRKILASCESAARSVSTPGDEYYFMVMEDGLAGHVVGTAAIIARLGEGESFYSYKINRVTHKSRVLDKRVTVQLLNLSNHFEGFAEVATQFLAPGYRRGGNGTLLARSRYLFMRRFRQRFGDNVMADLRGYYDESGRSPFWEAVGRHFFDMEFAEADMFGALHGNQFITDLMPTQPVYVNLLPEDAQAVIGRVNSAGEAALNMLQKEGFRWREHIDIFDGAPSVDCPIDELVTVSGSRELTFLGAEAAPGDQRFLLAAGSAAQFVACADVARVSGDGVFLRPETVDVLGLSIGDTVTAFASD
jgi:arginine N-succinyltransferase